MAIERLQKILARGGFSSRRPAEKAIADGRVRVNGRVVTELGSKADPFKDKVEVNGERVVAEHLVYVVLNKPRGVVTTMSDPEGRPSVRQILAPIGARVFPVGRLDFATSGVLLATNDGDFAEGMMHPKKAVPKTYVVKVANKMETKDLDRWREGIRLEDGMTLPAKAKMLRHEGEKTWFELTIREGRNQQIRRMGDATGFPVMRLSRVSFAGVTSDDLRPGEWRYLTREELLAMKQEYGVPKRVTVGDAREALQGRALRSVLARGARGKDTHARGPEARGARSKDARGAGGDARSGRAVDERGGRGAESRGLRGAEGRASRGADERGGRGAESRGARGAEGRAPRGKNTHARGRDAAEPRSSAPRGGDERVAPAREAGGRRDRQPRRTGDAPAPGGRRGRSSAGPSAGARETSASPEKSPRYGGGSPGRRGYDVRQDWGGGAGRGRTGSDREEGRSEAPRRGSAGPRSRSNESTPSRSDEQPRGELGGRGGQSRTTGTGGGAGARDGDYRMRSRRK